MPEKVRFSNPQFKSGLTHGQKKVSISQKRAATFKDERVRKDWAAYLRNERVNEKYDITLGMRFLSYVFALMLGASAGFKDDVGFVISALGFSVSYMMLYAPRGSDSLSVRGKSG